MHVALKISFCLCIAFMLAGFNDAPTGRLLTPIENGVLYPGGWSDDGATLYATLHQGASWQVIEIEVSSGNFSVIDVGLSGAGVGDVKGGKLLLESVEDGGSDIYMYDLETKSLSQLTNSQRYEWHPVFSPDQTAIAYDISTQNGPDIYLHQLTDGSIYKLVGDPASEQAAKFSPDGSKIAFHRRVGNDANNYDMILKDLASGAERVFASSDQEDGYPNWHPDGDWIVFSSNRNGAFDLFLTCPDGEALQQLTNTPDNAKYPKWSPDGRSIVFQSDRDNRRLLYVMNVPSLPSC